MIYGLFYDTKILLQPLNDSISINVLLIYTISENQVYRNKCRSVNFRGFLCRNLLIFGLLFLLGKNGGLNTVLDDTETLRNFSSYLRYLHSFPFFFSRISSSFLYIPICFILVPCPSVYVVELVKCITHLHHKLFYSMFITISFSLPSFSFTRKTK